MGYSQGFRISAQVVKFHLSREKTGWEDFCDKIEVMDPANKNPKARLNR